MHNRSACTAARGSSRTWPHSDRQPWHGRSRAVWRDERLTALSIKPPRHSCWS